VTQREGLARGDNLEMAVYIVAQRLRHYVTGMRTFAVTKYRGKQEDGEMERIVERMLSPHYMKAQIYTWLHEQGMQFICAGPIFGAFCNFPYYQVQGECKEVRKSVTIGEEGWLEELIHFEFDHSEDRWWLCHDYFSLDYEARSHEDTLELFVHKLVGLIKYTGTNTTVCQKMQDLLKSDSNLNIRCNPACHGDILHGSHLSESHKGGVVTPFVFRRP